MERLNQDCISQKWYKVTFKVLAIVGSILGIMAICVGAAWGIFAWTTSSIDTAITNHEIVAAGQMKELSLQIKEIVRGIIDLNIKVAQMQTDLKYLIKDRR